MPHIRLTTLLFLFSSPVFAQSGTEDFGGVAPEDCWYMRGGNSARSGQSLTAPVRGPVEVRWDRDFQGEIAGEPLAWRDLIFVDEKRSSSLRYLHVLRRSDGLARYKPRRVATSTPLALAVWGEHLVYRRAINRLEVLRLTPGGLVPMTTSKRWKFSGPVSEPILADRSVFVFADGMLQAFTVGLASRQWQQAEEVIGDFALRGDKLYLPVSGKRFIELVIRKRSTGELIRRISSDMPANMYRYAFVEAGAKAFVMHLSGIDPRIGDQFVGQAPNAVVFRRGVLTYSTQTVTASTSFAWSGSRWLAQVRGANGYTWARSSANKIQVLADKRIHGELLESKIPISLSRDVAYLGSMAFDLGSLEVLWDSKTGSVGRAIPIRGGLLTTPSAKQLCYLGSLGGDQRAGAPWLSASVVKDGVVRGGVAIVRDGTSVQSDFRVDVPAKLLLWGKDDDKSLPLDQLTWLSDDSGVPVMLSSRVDAGIVLEKLEAISRRRRIRALLPPARSSKDIGLFAKIIDMAVLSGADAKALKPFGTKLRQMQKLRHKYKPVAKKVAPIRAALRSLDADVQKDIWKIYSAVPDDVSFGWRYQFLHEILVETPAHAGAVEAVRGLLPESLRKANPFNAIDWLEFAKASREIDLKILEPGDRLDTSIAWERRELTRYQMEWGGKGRKDLVGIASQHLFVIGSSASPGSLARCVSIGELVCSKLDEMFETKESLRGESRRLKIILFDSRKEYLGMPDLGKPTLATRRRAGHLSWTAGHYSRRENSGDGVSRMFLPKDDAEFRKVIGVFAHELTHHWLDQACPRFSLAQRRAAHPMPKGYWIVEGFAQLMEKAVFDTQRRRVTLRNPANSDLAMVADKSTSQGVFWQALFPMNHMTQARLPTKPGSSGKVMMRYRLGAYIPASQMGFFYAQSAAACQYLYHAEDGKHRAKLLDYVVNYYTAKSGKPANLAVQQSFGMSARDLGKAVTTYAKRVVNQGKW